MTHEQLQVLSEWVDARIDERIEDRLGNDSLYESVRQRDLYTELKRAFGIEEEDT